MSGRRLPHPLVGRLEQLEDGGGEGASLIDAVDESQRTLEELGGEMMRNLLRDE